MTVIPTLGNRKTARAALAAFFETARVAGDLSVAAVAAYPKAKIQGVTPLLTIESVGSTRSMKQGVMWPLQVAHLQIHLFVPYKDESVSWTEVNSTDALDDIEQQVTGLLSLHGDPDADWYVEITERSFVDLYLEGTEFLHEVIPVSYYMYNIG